ncbi:VlmB-like protein [Streptomyces flavofungini]|uniref:VlmB-like protein n=1 Tax=Streptomyces flavofungini TaxID=68200 RepID=A0ABS0XJ52_9ACTN|nr:VlmB-like protein [Streptomyces flavofungini]MBJ3813267.1 VlmB-like protein [Streptomyces flavofungini]GHC90909.1 hypothetical protein GCM10010349_79270 [Streptomyces flavofungini]
MTTADVPVEADWERAPSLMDGAMSVELTAAQCDLKYWLASVPHGTLQGHVMGHADHVQPLAMMRTPGPLNTALKEELAYRSLAEEKATRVIGHLVALAPDLACLEFYATQLLDEARHAMVFRSHLLDLGVSEERLHQEIQELAKQDSDAILDPLEAFGLRILRDEGDFIGGVLALTVLVEGVLAPAAELSEQKWRIFDPAAADIERGAGIDEIRHLTVGSSIIREHLLAHPQEKKRLLRLMHEGFALWDSLPVDDQLLRRENLFQQGIDEHSHLLGDYQVWPGRRLADTSARERITTGQQWAQRMQSVRLAFAGLEGTP